MVNVAKCLSEQILKRSRTVVAAQNGHRCCPRQTHYATEIAPENSVERSPCGHNHVGNVTNRQHVYGETLTLLRLSHAWNRTWGASA